MYKVIVGFSKLKGFAPLGRLIMLIERTKFSHAFIEIYSSSLNRRLIYQANKSGVFFVGNRIFEEKNTVVKTKEFQISEEAKIKFLSWAVDNSGKSYSLLGLLGLGISRLLGAIGIKIDNPVQEDEKEYFCTKLVAAALEEVGFKINEDNDNIGLKELEQIIDKL